MAHQIIELIGNSEQFKPFPLNNGKFLVKIYLDYFFYIYQYFLNSLNIIIYSIKRLIPTYTSVLLNLL